jgi:hypothetical protein
MMHTTADLFSGFDPATVAAIRSTQQAAAQAQSQSRAHRAAHRHHVRRANAEAQLADLLPATIQPGDSWHVISRGDIDALSYVRHLLPGLGYADELWMSTWCIAKPDLDELAGWIDSGRVDQFALFAGEIFPNQYGDEYELMQRLCATYGCRMTIARNHSKVTLMANHASQTHLVIESSANVNTNPRIEQSTIHHSAELHAFYKEFFDGLKSIDRERAPRQ